MAAAGWATASDEDLLAAARAHPAAFGEFYERHARRVTAFFFRRTHDVHTSAELTAETFAQAWDLLRRYDPGVGAPMSWMLGIASNLHRNLLKHGVVSNRARRRWGLTTPVVAEDDLERIEGRVDDLSLCAALGPALESLSPALRTAVVLRIGLDLPYQEVADRLGCSVAAARVRVSRAIELLNLRLRGAT